MNNTFKFNEGIQYQMDMIQKIMLKEQLENEEIKMVEDEGDFDPRDNEASREQTYED